MALEYSDIDCPSCDRPMAIEGAESSDGDRWETRTWCPDCASRAILDVATTIASEEDIEDCARWLERGCFPASSWWSLRVDTRERWIDAVRADWPEARARIRADRARKVRRAMVEIRAEREKRRTIDG